MAQLLIRRIDEDVKENLRRRAKRHGVSMEEEARMILRAELLRDESGRPGLGTQIAELFAGIKDNDEPLEESRDHPVRYATFDE